MTSICVIQARMGSTRLPGKVVTDLAGRPMLGFMIERLRPLRGVPVVIATSDLDRDDPVVEVAKEFGAEVVRGPEKDVLARYEQTIRRFEPDVVVRLTADCPLVDPQLVRAGLCLLDTERADYVSNTIVRTYPDGLDVEVIDASVLLDAAGRATAGPLREHVTPFVYRHPERYRIVNLRNDEPLGRERWTVDTLRDLDLVREAVRELTHPTQAPWRDVLEVLGERRRPPPTEFHLRPAMPADAATVLAWRNDADAVRWSKSRAPVDREEHFPWFRDRLLHGGSLLYMGEVGGKPVGHLRVEVRAAVGTVSIVVAPEERGHGVGTALLSLLRDEVSSGYQVDRLEAEIDSENTASRAVFRRAGFSEEAESAGFVRLGWQPDRPDAGRA